MSGPNAMAPSHCWLHPGVAVRESKIEGRGLFATVRLVEGTSVSRVGGRIVPSTALASLLAARDHDPSQPYVDTIMIDDDAHLILPPGNLDHYGNHSCDPNLWWADGFTLDARRDIEPGTELTNDYGTSTGDPAYRMPCSCGSSVCRSAVTGEDWRRLDLRARYGSHWVPALQRRITAGSR